MKNLLNTIAMAITAVLLSGCAGSLYSPVPKGQTAYDAKENASYIVFSRPEFVGAALINTIVEFNPNTHETKYIGTLGPQTKLVYKTTPGTHYFYMAGGENDDMIKISTKRATEYYVHTAVGMGIMVGRFYFKPLRYPSLALAESLKGKSCSSAIMTQYGFKEVKDEVSEITGDLIYNSAKHNINIECYRGVIKHATYDGESLSNLMDAELIQPNKEGKDYYNKMVTDYVKEIKEDFADWKANDMAKTEVHPNDGKSIK